MFAMEADVRDPLDTGARTLPPALGRDERLRAVVVAHFDFVWRQLRRIGVPPSDVDDAAQQVFLVAADRLDDIASGSERAFLFGTAVRVATTARRQRARERPDNTTDSATDPTPLPDELTDQKRARELLDVLLDGLDEDVRAIFVLFELEGMKLVEIAALVGAPLGTVASRLRRAREQFDALLRRYEARTPARGGGKR